MSGARRLSLLDELQDAHQNLDRCLAALATALAAPQPDARACLFARWELTKASRRRWLILETRAFPAIRARGADTPAFAALAAELEDWRDRSAAHLARWPLNRPIADWDGFRAASDALRARMQERITRERAVLYPLLAND